ncbi:response regulator [Paenibacillus paridis]|uniref:response regulator n=1 Tax=Paenibacillus paridis TaxID=2583376 RepID=UPI00111D8A4E|nr:response regulator [Paenibacillus paridis]
MLKVLLADDERIILRGLHKLIDWQAFGMEIIGEVYSGTELLESIQTLRPDLVVSDIVMPGMTGIDVLKLIKKEGISTYVIFLSAFREFTYAQEALALGAVDYLVKPVDQTKLENAIMKALAMVKEVSHSEHRLSRLAELEQQQSKTQEKELLELLIEGERVELTTRALKEYIGEQVDVLYSVLLIEQEDILINQGNWEESGWKLLQFAIQNVIKDTINESGLGWVLVRQKQICAIFSLNEGSDPLSAISCIHERLSAYLKISVTLGLSTGSRLEQLYDRYTEAETAIGFRFFLGSRSYISYEQIPQPPENSGRPRDAIEKDMVQAITNSTPSQATRLCEEWVKAVSGEAWGNREMVVHCAYALLHVLAHQVSELGCETELRDEQELTQRLWSFHTCEELGGFVHEEIVSLMLLVGPKGDHKEVTQLDGVKKYIAEHYKEEIKLESMAALVYMNPSYFSTFFKKQTGKNFKQYLTELRMKEGHRLLMQTDLMVYEVAEAVGYNNPRHFSDMFRKHYGKLPNDYRQS